MRLLTVITAFLVLSFSLPVSAELTEAEKVELTKLWQGQALCGEALALIFNEHNKYPDVTYGRIKRIVISTMDCRLHASVANLQLLGVDTLGWCIDPNKGITKLDCVMRSLMDAIEGAQKGAKRATTLSTIVISPEFSESLLAAAAIYNEALETFLSFNLDLLYEDPYLDIHPRQFGHHGDYTKSQEILWRTVRAVRFLPVYIGTSYREGLPVGNKHIPDILPNLDHAFNTTIRAANLAARVAVHPEDTPFVSASDLERALHISHLVNGEVTAGLSATNEAAQLILLDEGADGGQYIENLAIYSLGITRVWPLYNLWNCVFFGTTEE